MIIVTARLVFETQENRDRAAAASSDVQAATRAEEPGCLMYCFAPDPAVPTEIQVFELWEDPTSLEAHFAHANYLAMVKALGKAGGLLQSINRMYVADDRGTVYDEDNKPRIHALLNQA
jgi:quinol monooxygenase YgiN